MKKDSIAYAEHVLDLFTEILHKAIIVGPLREVGLGITPALAQGIQFIHQHGVCSVKDIAEGLSMTYSAASQLTDRLVKKGLVTRRENARDRRLTEIELTNDGFKLAEKIRLRRVTEMSRILGRMRPASREMLVQTLEDFITAVVKDDRTALEVCSHCGRDHVPECVINEVYQAATGMPIRRT
ncbi:MAG: MarR family transcriptional regulator [Armatimonadetes bacterium]|nr:MarR family transcriptional regulator [Armatimonadota bacterium]